MRLALPSFAASTRPPRWIRIGLAGCFLSVQLLVTCNLCLAQAVPEITPPASRITSKLLRYAERVVERYDSNGDGVLDSQEWQAMRGRPGRADLNGDGQITVEEFAQHVANYAAGRRILLATPRDPVAQADPPLTTDATQESEPVEADPALLQRRRGLKYTAALPPGTPAWFVERDRDGDGQLTLAEFSPKLRPVEVAEFHRYDLNGDGLLTPDEILRAGSIRQNERSAAP